MATINEIPHKTITSFLDSEQNWTWLANGFSVDGSSVTIPDDSITSAMIVARTIQAVDIQAATITTVEIGANTIRADNIAADTITANEIHADAITTSELAADSVTSAKIVANTIVAADIAANTITASQIAAQTITSVQIASATITSGQVASGTLTGGNIAAGTIQTSNLVATAIDGMTITGSTVRTSSSNPKVQMDSTGISAYNSSGTLTFKADASTGKITTLAGIGGPNLHPNGSFEYSTTTGWGTDGSCTLNGFVLASSESIIAPHGLRIGKLTMTGSTGYLYYSLYEMIAVPGRDYTHSFSARTGSGTGLAAGWLQFADSGGTTIQNNQGTGSTINSTGWTRVSVTATAPANTKFVRAVNWIPTNTASQVVYIDQVQIEEGSLMTSFSPKPDEILPETVTTTEVASSTLLTGDVASQTLLAGNIATGTITATQIATGTITATQIAGTTITGAKIAANTIDTGQLVATAIDAMTITGATFRTSSGASRVQIEGSGGINGLYISTDSGTTKDLTLTSSGLALLEGTVAKGSAPTRRQVNWLNSSGSTKSYIESSNNGAAGPSYLTALTQSTGTSTEALVSLEAYGRTSTSVQAPIGSLVITSGTGVSKNRSKVEIITSTTTKKLLESDGTSDYLLLASDQTVTGDKRFDASATFDANDPATYDLKCGTNGYLAFHDDTSYAKIQSFAGKGLLLNALGNNVTVGSNTAVSSSLMIAVKNGDCFEFGHSNSSGYRGTLGAFSSAGNNFLALHAEHGTNANTFRTRGVKGTVFISDTAGGYSVYSITNTSADNQAGTSIYYLETTGATNIVTDVWHKSYSDGKQRLYYQASSITYFKSGWDSTSLFEFRNASDAWRTRIDSAGAVTSASDARIKEEFVEPTKVLERVSKMPVYNYRLKDDPDELRIGVTAQDFYKAFPELQLKENLKKDAQLGISYSDEIGVLQASVRELAQEIKELKNGK